MQNKYIDEIIEDFKSGNFDLAENKASLFLKKFPNNYFLHNISGAIFSSKKKYDEAIKCFQNAIKINPYIPEGYYNLGNSLLEMGRYEKSIKYFQKAIKIKPNYIKAHLNLGNVYVKLNDFQNAIAFYEKIIEIDDRNLDAYHKLAILYCDICKIEESQKNFKKLLKLEPNNILNKINQALLLLPIYKSKDEINLYRDMFISGLSKLQKYKYITDKPGSEVELNFYYLAYHNKNNLGILKKISKLFRKMIPSINYVSKNTFNKKKLGKIKIGFISEFLTNHTVGKLFGGLIKNIDKTKFNVIIFHAENVKKSDIKNEIDVSADKVIELKNKISEQQIQVDNENLDIVFYPDLGMSPTTYFLAFSRFAPVQIASWGHTETSGIDTIDYFISSKLFENNKAQKNYSEKLICLDRVPTYFELPKKINKLKSRRELGLPENSNLYGCPQSLFKLHPDCDYTFSEILKKDSDGYIVLIESEGKGKFWSKILKNRWLKKFPILNQRVIFTKQLSQEDFFSLSNCVDVLLVPQNFGGGNTTLEAMIFGTPSITIEGDYLRTNITSGLYKQIKILNPPVVKNINEYINLAVKLARNKTQNKYLREITKKAANKYLFKNDKTIKEIEKVLEQTFLKSKS